MFASDGGSWNDERERLGLPDGDVEVVEAPAQWRPLLDDDDGEEQTDSNCSACSRNLRRQSLFAFHVGLESSPSQSAPSSRRHASKSWMSRGVSPEMSLMSFRSHQSVK